jgi:hypothetical protein
MISEIFSLSIGTLTGLGIYVITMIGVESHLAKERKLQK